MESLLERPTRPTLGEVFAQLVDPRMRRTRVHELVPLLLASVLAMMCGARSLYAIAQWSRERCEDDPTLLETLGLMPGRSPSVATLHRVFSRVDPKAVEDAIAVWVGASVAADEPIAVDGKTMRGVHGAGLPGVHLVAAFATRSRIALAQEQSAGKGHELAAAEAVLGSIPLARRVITADALMTQRRFCQLIMDGGGDYVVPAKGNQPELLRDCVAAFSPSGG